MQKNTPHTTDATQQRIIYAKQLIAFLHSLRLELTAESLDQMLPTLNILEEAADNDDTGAIRFYICLSSSLATHPNLLLATNQCPMKDLKAFPKLQFLANSEIDNYNQAIVTIDFTMYDRITLWDLNQYPHSY